MDAQTDGPAPAGATAELEGMIAAHRLVLATLVRMLAAERGGAAAFCAVLGRELLPGDGGEDPGALSDPAFAIEAAMRTEIERVLRLAHISPPEDAAG